MTTNRLPALLLLALVATADAGPNLPVTICAPPPAAPTPPHTITVTGTATLEVTPDLLDVRMVLTQAASRPSAAIAGLRARQAQLLKALPAGVETRLSTLALAPTTDEKGRPTGYQASLVLVATTPNGDLLGAIAETAADANVTDLSSSWRRSDLPAMKEHVRALALEAARAKAAQTAKVLDVKLGAVDTVVEYAGGAAWNQNANVANMVENATAATGVDPSATELSLTVTLTIEMS